MKKLIYSQEDLDLVLSLELQQKEDEIERLNKELNETAKYLTTDTLDYIKEKNKEIERLNNIINELEKELKDMATLKTDKYGNTRKITHIDINWLLLKIKELKGDGSNDN